MKILIFGIIVICVIAIVANLYVKFKMEDFDL
jgi:hypothetical protein